MNLTSDNSNADCSASSSSSSVVKLRKSISSKQMKEGDSSNQRMQPLNSKNRYTENFISNRNNYFEYQLDDGGQAKESRVGKSLWFRNCYDRNSSSSSSIVRMILMIILGFLLTILVHIRSFQRSHNNRQRFWRIDENDENGSFIRSEKRISATEVIPIQILDRRTSLSRNTKQGYTYINLPNNDIGESASDVNVDAGLDNQHIGGLLNDDVYSRKMTNSYYAFDDDEVRAQDFESDHCRRPSFQRMHNPSCNSVHELDMNYDWNILVGVGYYRSAFQYWEDDYIDVIIKTIRFPNHDFDHWNFEFQRNDAMMMQLLQSSHHAVEIYGHCSGTVITESAVEDLSDRIVPYGGYMPEEGLYDEDDVNPLNNLTIAEKLDIALEMAECLGDMHGFNGGVLVHDDVQVAQFWRGKDGYMKIIDFNRAEAMLYDTEAKQYCKYLNGPVWGNYRSPEEVNVRHLDEKIDVFSYGNNLYAILTGLWVYYYDNDDGEMQRRIRHGQVSYIDPRYRDRSFGEAFLVRLLEICWFYNPQDRPSIFDVIELLQNAIAWNDKLMSEGKDIYIKDWMPILDEIIYVIHQ